MTEHKIRLRAGWTLQAGTSAMNGDPMITLPMHMPPSEAGEWRLSRSFGQPKVAIHEAVWLEMSDVSGVVRSTLNDATLPPVTDGRLSFQIVPALLNQRNRLTLEVDWTRSTAPPGSEWGSVSLVIRAAAPLPKPGPD